ncbi:coiled-coil domain-containing protein [Helicobacter sp. 11S03491-1]|uniref:coiled-coil domain-containing protein n=1 Tax=Helicobacter sp. 11S03491-1 TaxID=1476196 RepID=UPI000BA5EF5C|nr:coiled-coil domain-containing protein [Helicobacter sp. 11S03491-1]
MLQYSTNMKGETMPYAMGLTREAYNIIYETFPDKNQADGVASVFEKVLLQLDVNSRVVFDERLETIILSVKEKLGAEFATKSDLEALKAVLEKQIAELRTELKQDTTELKVELKTEIAELRTEIAVIDTKVTNLSQDFNNKLNSFKFSMIKWVVGTLVITLGVIATLAGLLTKLNII